MPYDSTLPVDLSGMPGVTPQQEAEAEALVTANIQALPRCADPDVAYAAGYRSVDDSNTGVEHYVNWSLINDGRNPDAQYPESLVYTVERDGGRTLEAAMYVLEPPATLDTVPPLGGPLVQYHVLNDLCWSGEDGAFTVFGAELLPPAPPAATGGCSSPCSTCGSSATRAAHSPPWRASPAARCDPAKRSSATTCTARSDGIDDARRLTDEFRAEHPSGWPGPARRSTHDGADHPHPRRPRRHLGVRRP